MDLRSLARLKCKSSNLFKYIGPMRSAISSVMVDRS